MYCWDSTWKIKLRARDVRGKRIVAPFSPLGAASVSPLGINTLSRRVEYFYRPQTITSGSVAAGVHRNNVVNQRFYLHVNTRGKGSNRPRGWCSRPRQRRRRCRGVRRFSANLTFSPGPRLRFTNDRARGNHRVSPVRSRPPPQRTAPGISRQINGCYSPNGTTR